MSEKSSNNKSQMLMSLAGVCGVLGSALPLFMVILATFLSSWFSWNVNALSELGVGQQAALFNSAVLMGGVLNFLFALGLNQHLGRGKLIKAGIISIMLSSISLAFVGVFTVDYSIPHGIAAFGYFVLAPAGFILIGSGTKDGIIRKISFGCGVGALISILVLPLSILALHFEVGFAVPELVEGLIISIWTIYMSTRLARR
jgi:hypothetical membrane protein